MEALRHAQAKCSELEKTNKKLQEHALTGRKEIARLKEELQVFRSKVSNCVHVGCTFYGSIVESWICR